MKRKQVRVLLGLLGAASILVTHTPSPVLAQTSPPALGAQFISEGEGIREYRLANGMKVLLVENRVAPVATVLVVYKVGSRDEAVGYTGSTHLLEHMLFKGTPEFNKQKGTQIAAVLQRIGARFNATTWYDRTTYFETVPADQIELAIRLEADRMRNSFIADADRQSEMTVVRNELERGQNNPEEVLDEAIYAAAFNAHPYHHPTIGWRSDVENVPTERLKQFYDTYYHPANATAIVVGDFDRDTVLPLLGKYFGAYGPPPAPIPQVYTEEPPQQGERRLVIRRTGDLPIVKIAFRTPAALGQLGVLSDAQLAERSANPPAPNDGYTLDLLATALTSGVTSRLYQSLVETQLAVSVSANADSHRDPGLFTITASLRPGVAPEKVESIILAELDRVTRQGLTVAEVDKARQQILAQLAYGRDGTSAIAAQLAEAEAIADWHYYKDYGANLKKVVAPDMSRVATAYFTAENRTVGYFIPKASPATPRAGGVGRRGIQFYQTPEEGTPVAPGSASTMQPGTTAPQEAKPATNFVSRVARTRLPSGSTLLVLENHATPSVSFRGSLLAGAYFEPREKPGLAGMAASLLERGTKKRTRLQLAQALESVGAQLDISADTFSVGISGRALSADLPLVIRVLAEELREPSFPADELEKLKQQAIAAVRERQTSTGYRSYQRFASTVYQPSSPFYAPDGDKLIASLQSITTEEVRQFYKKHYGGRSLILSVVGDVQTPAVTQQFREAFGTFEGPTDAAIVVSDPVPQSTTKRASVVIKDKASVDIILGSAATLRRTSNDYYAALLANSALGQSTLSSRLGLQIRDKQGLTYGIGSRFSAPSLAAGPWYITVSVNPKNVEKAVASTLSVLSDYVQNGIRPEELAGEKSSASGSFKVSLSTNTGIAQALWSAEFFNLGIDYLDRFPQLINQVSVEEVNTAIRKYFRPEQLTIVTAGDYLLNPEIGKQP